MFAYFDASASSVTCDGQRQQLLVGGRQAGSHAGSLRTLLEVAECLHAPGRYAPAARARESIRKQAIMFERVCTSTADSTQVCIFNFDHELTRDMLVTAQRHSLEDVML